MNVVVAVTAAQPPTAATLLVTVYVPAVDEARVMAPVVALIVKPAVELNVPAVAPVPRLGVTLVVAPTQPVAVA